MLPAPPFLSVLRRARGVVESPRRRPSSELLRRYPRVWTLKRLEFDTTYRRRRIFEWWLASNAAILQLSNRHPERWIVCDHDRLRSQMPQVRAHMR